MVGPQNLCAASIPLMSTRPPMSKNTKPTEQNKPQGAQVDAVRRLIQNGNLAAARTRLTTLRRSFPAHKPLLAMAWEIEDQAGASWAAAARAFDWAQVSAASKDAQSALAEAAFAIGLVALGYASSLRLARLRGMPAAPFQGVDTPLGPLSGEEAELADISRLLLQDGRYDEMIERLVNASHPALRNNLALGYFAQGEMARARDEFESNWRQHPLNLFALEYIVRLRLWCEGQAHAAPLATVLLASTPLRAEDALGKLGGLILLGEWQAAAAYWQGAPDQGQQYGRRDQVSGLWAYAGAVLALRDGDWATASERLRLAAQASPAAAAIRELQQALASGADWHECIIEIGALGAWFPAAWFSGLLALRDANSPDLEPRVQRYLRSCDAHADYLGLAVQLGGQQVRLVAMEILMQRAKQGDAQAKAQLITLLACPCGPDGYRTRLLEWLRDESLIERGASMPVLLNGEVRSIAPLTFRLTPEPVRDNPYPPAIQERYEDMVELLGRRRPVAALEIALEIGRLAPDVPMSHVNLALIREGIGERGEEIEALFRRALELDEHYIFARAGLARVLARLGQVEAAKAMLEPVFPRDEYHYSEWRTILLAQREVALAQGDVTSLAALEQSLRDLDRLQAP
jgi:tetratricopeptide (TPR) repeat protein